MATPTSARARLAHYLDLDPLGPAGRHAAAALADARLRSGSAADGFPGWHLLAVFVLGTFLMRSAGCAANDVADRDFDRHVKRTANRPGDERRGRRRRGA